MIPSFRDTQKVNTQLAVRAGAPRRSAWRMVASGSISVALLGVFALPAYASSTGSIGTAADAQTAYAQALATQALTISVGSEVQMPHQVPLTEEQPVEVQRAVEVETPGWAALPAGSGMSGIVNAALAQIGMDKDCTDVAQDSLAAIGLVTSRFNGGPDLGVSNFAAFGAVYTFSKENLAPGDLLVWPEAPHVAIYVGDGQVVHGGWHPTALAGFENHGIEPDYVVRVG